MNDLEKASENKPPKRKGRPKGALNRLTRQRLAALATAGMGPLEWLAHVVSSPLYNPRLRTLAAICLAKHTHPKTGAMPDPVPSASNEEVEAPTPPPLPLTADERDRLRQLQRYHRWQLVGLEAYDMVKERELDDLARRAGESREGTETSEEYIERRHRTRVMHGYDEKE
jgi:hypothetical protein